MLDPIRPLIWQDRRVAWYYRQNCFLFVRNDIVDTNKVYRDIANIYANNDMILLHDHVLAAHLSLLYSLKRLPGFSVATLKRILASALSNIKSTKELK